MPSLDRERKDSSTRLLEALQNDPLWMKRPFFAWMGRHMALILLSSSLFLLYGYFLTHKIDLTTADLGRHIKNGEMPTPHGSFSDFPEFRSSSF